MTVRRSRRTTTAGVLVLALGVVGACAPDPVDPARAGTVVVTTDLPFASLNGATAAGRAPGSVLVRGLVQAGFTSLAPDGSVVADPSFGTVEKVADSPLTVRYTIAPTARWSDGVPVTPADLVLEWAARSGQLDEVVPVLDRDGSPADVPEDVVAFAATSPAVADATAVPVVDGATVTVVHDAPVADWRVALDVNLPAHVVGRAAFAGEGEATGTDPDAAQDAAPEDGGTAGATGAAPSTGAEEAAGDGGTVDAERWAQAVLTAVQQQDRAALVAISAAWRTAGLAGDVGDDPALTTTTGPFVLSRVGEDGVEMVRNEAYAGDRPAGFETVAVRTDLDPLAQIEALDAGEVDVAAPLSTPDVLEAVLALGEDAVVRTAGDAVLQLVVQEGAGGVFDPATHADAQDPAAAAAALRRAFLAAVEREEVVTSAVAVLWEDAPVSDVVAAQVGPEGPPAGTSQPVGDAGPAGTGPVTVRALVNTADPVRAAVLDGLVRHARAAGFVVEPVEVTDPAAALRTRPEDWDVAVVPVPQEDVPVASFVARWRTGGAANVTGHADPALDVLLDALAVQPDAAAAAAGVTAASDALVASGAVLPLARTPVLTATAARSDGRDRGLPVLDAVPALPPGAADLTWWWNWTRR